MSQPAGRPQVSPDLPDPDRRWPPPTILDRPGLWLLAILLATLPFALALGRLQIRTDGEALYPIGSPIVEATRLERDRFNDPEAVVVLVAARPGGAGVFGVHGFAFMQALTETLRTVPGVRSDDVLSIATLTDVTASSGRIRLSRYLEPLPVDEPGAAGVRDRILGERLYRGLLFANDGSSAAILVPLAPAAPRVETVHRIRARLANVVEPAFDVRFTGPVVAETLLGEQILSDLIRLVPLVVLVVALALLICLRQAVAALTVLTGMLVVLVWTFGAMAAFGVPLTLVTSVLPVLLMAMAVNDQIHLLERVQRHLATGASKADALRRAFADVGRPIVRTSLTTALGFLAFTTTSVTPMRHFGLFAAFGLLLAMGFAFTLVPALVMVLPFRPRRAGVATAEHAPWGVERWAGRKPAAAAMVALALLLLALAGLPALRVEDSWVENFDPHSDLAQAAALFDRDYLGSYRLDVTLESPQPGAFRLPAGLRLVDSVQTVLGRFPEISGTRSVADLARAGLSGIDPARDLDALPPEGLAQLFMMLEMSGRQESVDRLLTRDGSAARITCYVRGADYSKSRRLLARVEQLGHQLERAHGVQLRASGDLAVANEVVRATVLNQVRSVAVTLVGLAAVMALSFGSPAVALVLIAPVAATTLIVLGGMGALGIPLGVATSMFAALAEGEGAGFAIHLASRYLDLRRHQDRNAALNATLGSVGTAVRWNGLVVIAGCLVLCFSGLRPVRALGGLLAAGMAVSYLMTFLALPALLLRLRTATRSAAIPMVVLALACGMACGASDLARAAEPASRADDPEARRLMRRIERDQRLHPRIFSMDVALTAPGYTTERRMLGVLSPDRRQTRILYVITGPAFFRGATLLIHDALDPARADRMWISLPGLATLQELDATSLRLLVPGTGMTYEDSRGWISTDRYLFTVTGRAPGQLTLEARPRSDSLSVLLGISRLAIRVDPERRVVLGVASHDRAGTLVRTYAATSVVELDGLWVPARVETDHHLQRVATVITYTYATLKRSPPDDLFRAESRSKSFLDRLMSWTRRSGFARQFPDTLTGH